MISFYNQKGFETLQRIYDILFDSEHPLPDFINSLGIIRDDKYIEEKPNRFKKLSQQLLDAKIFEIQENIQQKKKIKKVKKFRRDDKKR